MELDPQTDPQDDMGKVSKCHLLQPVLVSCIYVKLDGVDPLIIMASLQNFKTLTKEGPLSFIKAL